MATVTLPVLTIRSGVAVTVPKDFEIDQLSFTRSITRQGKGARAAWRHQFRTLPEIPQSHAVIEWNATRVEFKEFNHQDDSYHGIRETYRRDVLDPKLARAELERTEKALQGDPWAMIDVPPANPTPRLHTDEQAAPGSDDR